MFCDYFGFDNTQCVDELQKSNVDIDMTVLSYNIHQCFEQYKTMYEKMAIRPVSIVEIFEKMNVNSFDHVVAYLALLYRMDIFEEDVMREAVCLVAPILKGTNIIRVEEESFI